MPSKNNIIIKKKEKKHSHTRHGGAWKIAYADFVTAMMTFFLLMWLINTVSEAQRKGIADYFARSFINFDVRNGAEGMLGGVIAAGDRTHGGVSLGGATPNIDNDEVFGTSSEKGGETQSAKLDNQPHDNTDKATLWKANNGDTQEEKDDKGRHESLSALVLEDQVRGLLTKDKDKKDLLIHEEVNRVMLHIPLESEERNLAKASAAQPGERGGSDQSLTEGKKGEINSSEPAKPKAINYLEKFEDGLMNTKQKKEQTAFKDISNAFIKAIKGSKDLEGLTNHVVFELRPEGLRIQLLDSDKYTMFPSGSAEALPKTGQLLHALVDLLRALQNRLVVSGHTDAYPYTNIRRYSNWELSADRANTVRRILMEKGIVAARFESVMGKEATDPINAKNPYAPENRRISITVLRDQPLSLDQLKQIQASSDSPVAG